MTNPIDYIGEIEVVSIPDGDAPEEIRAKWIGVRIPCLYHDKHSLVCGVLTGEIKPKQESFVVLQDSALNALQAKSPEATVWWNNNGFPWHITATFMFSAGSCVVTKPVMEREVFFELN